jgi:DNA helicase HerA-like ATPase
MARFSRIGLFGRSQSGKSTLMDRALRGHKRVVLYDALPARAKTAQAEGFIKIESISDLMEAVRETYRHGFRFWFKPEDDEDYLVLSLSDLSKFLIDHQNQHGERYGWDKVPDMTLAVDEMADCFPNHTLPKHMNGFSKMCRAGRHSSIHLVGATQRPAEVSTKFRGQLEKRFLFNLTEPRDLKAIEEMGGSDGKRLAEAVRRLPVLEYIRMEGGTYTKGKLTFPG